VYPRDCELLQVADVPSNVAFEIIQICNIRDSSTCTAVEMSVNTIAGCLATRAKSTHLRLTDRHDSWQLWLYCRRLSVTLATRYEK